MVGSDAPRPGVDAPFGELATILLTAMNGADLCSGIGGLDLDAGCPLVQMVIDSVLWRCRPTRLFASRADAIVGDVRTFL